MLISGVLMTAIILIFTDYKRFSLLFTLSDHNADWLKNINSEKDAELFVIHLMQRAASRRPEDQLLMRSLIDQHLDVCRLDYCCPCLEYSNTFEALAFRYADQANPLEIRAMQE